MRAIIFCWLFAIPLISGGLTKGQCDDPNASYICASPCVATCQNRQFANCVAECEEKCFCNDDFILDEDSKRCVKTIDCDVFLVNPNTLNYLIAKNLTIVAPLLRSDGLYSNFWYGITEDYYYKRTEEYKPVLYRDNEGCFNVPMVHSCVLVDLKRKESDFLTYVPKKVLGYTGPHDDIITFAMSANFSGTSLHLCNEQPFGYVMVPLEQNDQLSLDFEQLTNIKLEVLDTTDALYVDEMFRDHVRALPEKDPLGFDRIFMINLKRRPERRRRMQACFDELGLDVAVLDAVDGK
ncbi:hypothetical protein JTB14_022134 [Gonioctena quinquepunctata]|nr:hypothetical protein JTB14_022134 [Gonioctena quinquepunctata]